MCAFGATRKKVNGCYGEVKGKPLPFLGKSENKGMD